MKNYQIALLLFITVASFGLMSCSENFLDAKPNKNMVLPESLNDLQGMLDFASYFNQNSNGLQQVCDDNIYVPDNLLIARGDFEQIAYTWEDYDPDISKFDWGSGYQGILQANIVLNQASNFEPNSSIEMNWLNNIIGSAHFFRAFKMWELLQIFSPVYNESTASQDLGIIINLTNNVQSRFPRSSVQESYNQVLSDLHKAVELLSIDSDYKLRPNRVAAYALLSRVYLSMSNYSESLKYSNHALDHHSLLMDYNSLEKTTVTTNAFPRFNDEVIFHSYLPTYGVSYTNNTTGGFIVPELYDLFHENDLRKELFFRNFGEFHRLLGMYTGIANGFGGLATDELYLNRAEAKVRLGDIEGGMTDLNTLLVTRWKTGTYVPYSAAAETEALTIILEERRKQLIHRGLRWTDLKRLNMDPRFAKTLTRTVQGVTYTLPPNDLRYAILIPNQEINLNNLVVQNPR